MFKHLHRRGGIENLGGRKLKNTRGYITDVDTRDAGTRVGKEGGLYRRHHTGLAWAREEERGTHEDRVPDMAPFKS